MEGELVVHLSSDNNTAADEDEEGRLSRLQSPPPAAVGLHHKEQSQERGIIEICHSIKRSRNEAVNVGVGKLGNYICISDESSLAPASGFPLFSSEKWQKWLFI